MYLNAGMMKRGLFIIIIILQEKLLGYRQVLEMTYVYGQGDKWIRGRRLRG
jgi:hypothetical protein